MQLAERRSVLKGIVATAVAAVIAPHVVPKVLEAIPVEAEPAWAVFPSIQMMQAFIPVSNELLSDFPNLEWEMTRMLTDSAREMGFEVTGPLQKLPPGNRWMPGMALFAADVSSSSR